MPQFAGRSTDRPPSERFGRKVTMLFGSSGLLLLLVAVTACAGLNDNGTDRETMETMEARENQAPPAAGSPGAAAPVGEGDAAAGEALYTSAGCVGCHSVDGSQSAGPTWQGIVGRETPLENGETVVADEAYIAESILQPQAKIHEGFGAIMPSYQGQLSEQDIADLIAYMKTLE